MTLAPFEQANPQLDWRSFSFLFMFLLRDWIFFSKYYSNKGQSNNSGGQFQFNKSARNPQISQLRVEKTKTLLGDHRPQQSSTQSNIRASLLPSKKGTRESEVTLCISARLGASAPNTSLVASFGHRCATFASRVCHFWCQQCHCAATIATVSVSTARAGRRRKAGLT